ncbi:hypothetical protein CCUS01_06244 [Colletotrichum cuscutae]|uniref:Uncharacterized protein n=1 Tax=Colletotrichum cuscutae TaxID=1209917 RepID=A0AAI9V7M9_9PEZI|nr:hypothetical protein CCUS01_06244 [Colletotrichum cuscutae]
MGGVRQPEFGADKQAQLRRRNAAEGSRDVCRVEVEKECRRDRTRLHVWLARDGGTAATGKRKKSAGGMPWDVRPGLVSVEKRMLAPALGTP